MIVEKSESQKAYRKYYRRKLYFVSIDFYLKNKQYVFISANVGQVQMYTLVESQGK